MITPENTDNNNMSVAFKHQNEIDHKPDFFRLPWSYLWEICRDGRTPIRAITDEAMKYYHRFLECEGTIYELTQPEFPGPDLKW